MGQGVADRRENAWRDHFMLVGKSVLFRAVQLDAGCTSSGTEASPIQNFSLYAIGLL